MSRFNLTTQTISDVSNRITIHTITRKYVAKMAYNLDRSSIATPISNSTPHTESTTKLLETIFNIDKAKIERLFFKHHVSIKTVFYVYGDFPESLILYCVIAMEMEEKDISSKSLLDECERLLDVIPETVLIQMMNNFGDITVASLELSRKSEKTTLTTCALGKTSGILTGGTSVHDTNNAPSDSIENHRKVQTSILVKDVDVLNALTFDRVNGAHSAHAQIRPEYEDEVDRVSLPSIPNYHFENSEFGSRNGAAKHGLSSPIDEPPLKSQHEETERLSSPGDEPRTLCSKERLEAVTRENEILETSLQCVQCKVRPRGLTFLPCGHFLVCVPCSVGVYVCSACDTRVLGEVATSTVSHIAKIP